jgi:hypothetical protein
VETEAISIPAEDVNPVDAGNDIEGAAVRRSRRTVGIQRKTSSGGHIKACDAHPRALAPRFELVHVRCECEASCSDLDGPFADHLERQGEIRTRPARDERDP